MAPKVKNLKVFKVLLGFLMLGNVSVYGEIKAFSPSIDAKKDIGLEDRMADAFVAPQPEKPPASVDPFYPISTMVDSPKSTDSANAVEFNINDLKVQGVMIFGAQASVLIKDGNTISKYSTDDAVNGYVIKGITTKGVKFEKDGKEFFLENTAR